MNLRYFAKIVFLLLIAVCGPARAADLSFTANDQIPAAFREFLETQNVTNLSRRVGPSLADWEAESQRFGRKLGSAEREELEKEVAGNIRNWSRSAESFLNQARRFEIVSTNALWTFRNATCDSLSQTADPRVHQKGETMPHTRSIRLTFRRESTNWKSSRLDGNYTIDLQFGLRFPDGWRVFNGFNWATFPKGVASPELHADMLLAATLPPHGGSLSSSNDPALNKLAQKLLTFFKSKDTNYFTRELMYSPDQLIKVIKERTPEREVPTREEVEQADGPRRAQAVASAQAVLAEADRFGINFEAAKIKEVVANDVDVENQSGIPAAFWSDELLMTLALPEIVTAAGKTIPAADFVIGSSPAQRIAGRWCLENLRWVRLPEGLLAKDEVARLEFENYVAKHRRLPPGIPAPEIEMFSLKDNSTVKLSDFRGKFVILEWWATWCGPCQEPMARMQKMRAANPNWGGRVELITLSIDDDSETARKHLEKRGWTNSVNLWAGGDWHSAAAKTFRVTAVPSLYIISPEGQIAESGAVYSWEQRLNDLLKSASKTEKR